MKSGRIGYELLAMRSSAFFSAAACAAAASRGAVSTVAAATPAPAALKKSRLFGGVLSFCS